jgi:elongation factor G
LHLDIVIERLRKEHGLKVRAGKPQVNCKERLRRSARVSEVFDHDFGGERLKVDIELEVQPGGPEANSVDFAEGLKLAPHFVDAIRRGVESALSVGPLAGWPVQEVATHILAFQPPAQGRSADVAVEAAAAQAARHAAQAAGAVLLEPVMQLDIECPEEYFGAVLGAISARAGHIESVEDGPWGKNISAAAPMRQLFGFATELRSLSKGRVQFQARFKSNSVVPT